MLFLDKNGNSTKPGSSKTLAGILRDPELAYAVKEYLIIQNEYNNQSSLKDNVIFRDCFSELYDMNSRKSTLLNFACKDGFFEVFDVARRTCYANENDRYNDIIARLHSNNINTVARDENEWVFASKMLHTINNNMPIIDSHIENIFNSVGISVSKNNYKDFANKYLNYISNNNDEVGMIVDEFNKVYPNTNINPIKIIDFVFWIADK